MITFLAENLGTIVVGMGLAAVVAAIIAKLVRDARRGSCVGCSSCGSTCPHSHHSE